MPTLSIEVANLIEQIKVAVANINDSDSSNVIIQSFKINVKTAFEISTNAKGNLDLVLLKINAKQSLMQTLEMEFILGQADIAEAKFIPTVSETLTSAAHAIDIALRAATKGVSSFRLQQGRVELCFYVEANGSLSFNLLGGDLNASKTNTITLIIRSKDTVN
jgi:hypothetical protein